MIHDERGEDAKRYDRRMEARMAIPVVVAVTENATTSMRAKGRANRSASMRRRSRKAPFRSSLTYVDGAKAVHSSNRKGMNGFSIRISQYQPLTG